MNEFLGPLVRFNARQIISQEVQQTMDLVVRVQLNGYQEKKSFCIMQLLLTAKNEDVRCHTKMEQCGLPR